MPAYRIFLLSPANSVGRRSDILVNGRGTFDLALRFRYGGASLGEVFSFLSGLYFRGKLAYANQFARPHPETSGVLIITSNRGLLTAETIVTTEDLKSFATVPIHASQNSYFQPLHQSAIKLSQTLPPDTEVVLLGSISTGKYVDPLLEIFQSKLLFPEEFVGRGDMSRGGLMLRCVDSMQELRYVPVEGAVRHGKRPPKLEPRRQRI
jgi:hypothetical protein